MRPLNFLLLLTPIFLIGCSTDEFIWSNRMMVTPQWHFQELETTHELRIQFYNVENLFDIEDDSETADEEFTPEGKKNWTTDKYQTKLEHLAKVLTAREGAGPSIIGLCEIENLKVVQDLASQPGLAEWDLGIVHKDSPDGRGIDVALLYPKKSIKILKEHYVESILPIGNRPNTRLAMLVEAVHGSDTLIIGVNHWPSRYGGQEKSEPNRLTVAYNVSKKLDELQAKLPAASVILMGDFNDYPNNKSMRSILGAGKEADSKYVNLMWDMSKSGIGTYNYKGDWGCLDQFVVSPNLVDGSGPWVVSPTDVVIPRYEWMMYTNDKGEVYPNRTYGGPNYYGGYSDHLPIDLVFRKKR